VRFTRSPRKFYEAPAHPPARFALTSKPLASSCDSVLSVFVSVSVSLSLCRGEGAREEGTGCGGTYSDDGGLPVLVCVAATSRDEDDGSTFFGFYEPRTKPRLIRPPDVSHRLEESEERRLSFVYPVRASTPEPERKRIVIGENALKFSDYFTRRSLLPCCSFNKERIDLVWALKDFR
jgi:hypothetical protein